MTENSYEKSQKFNSNLRKYKLVYMVNILDNNLDCSLIKDGLLIVK